MKHTSESMNGKTVILAGGSGGLGAAVADDLAARGAIPVIGCKANRDRAEALARAVLDKYGIRPPVVVGDILEKSVRSELIVEAQRAGTLYGLVPLVGQPARIPIENATDQDLVDSMRENFIGPTLFARDFAAALAGVDGAIVFIATMQAIGVFPGSTVYSAPKAAWIHPARILAKQWAIRVNEDAP